MMSPTGWKASEAVFRTSHGPRNHRGSRAVSPLPLEHAKHSPSRVSRLPVRVAEGRSQVPPSAEESLESLPLPTLSKGLPLFGDTFNLKGGVTAYARERIKVLGPVFRSKLWGQDCVFISGEANVRRVLQEEHELLQNVVSKAQLYLMGSSSLGLLGGAEHMRLRKLTAPSFTKSALSTHIPDIQAAALESCLEWAEQPSVKFADEAKNFTFRVISSVVLGMDLSLGEDRLMSDFKEYITGIFSLGINLGPFTRYGRGVRAKARLVQSVDQGLEKAQRLVEESSGGTRVPKLLEKLWTFQDPETGERLTEDEIRDQVLLLLFAGYATTAGTLTHLALELGRNPQILTKLREEQKLVMAAHGPDMDPEALEAMPYAEACVKEAMRVNPVVEWPLRKVAKEFEIEGFRVPVGWSAFPLIGHVTQYEDSRWPGEEHTYNPDRLLTEEGRKTGSWIPFGLGPHVCLGMNLSIMEAKIFLATLARGFDLSVENPDLEYAQPTDPKDGLPATITRRTVE